MPIIKLQYYKLFSTYTFFFSKKIINTMVSVIYFFHLFPFIPIKTLCRNSISAFFNDFSLYYSSSSALFFFTYWLISIFIRIFAFGIISQTIT